MRTTFIMRTISRILILFAVSLMLFACTDGGAGIFYSIEIEEPISNNDLPDFLTSQSAVKVGTDYYFGALQLYKGSASQIANSDDLSRVSLPDGWRYAMQIAGDDANTFVGDNTDTFLYAILENREGDNTAFYHNESGSLVKSTYLGFTGRPYKVWYIEQTDYIYVATVRTENEEDKRYSYRLYGGTDPNSLSQVILPSPFDSNNATSQPIVDVDFDVNNSDLVMITAADCFIGNTTTFTSIETSISTDLFKRSLYYSAHGGGTLFMATSTEALNGTGAVYEWDGANWVVFDADVGSDPNDFGDVTIDSGTYLLLGTQSGYVEMLHGGTAFGGESATINSDNYSNKELESAAVMGFLDGPGNKFFALTATNGIWRNDNGVWSQE